MIVAAPGNGGLNTQSLQARLPASRMPESNCRDILSQIACIGYRRPGGCSPRCRRPFSAVPEAAFGPAEGRFEPGPAVRSRGA
jgi:hypothetical protein